MTGPELCRIAEVGDRQRVILMRAAAGLVITMDNAERCAARRLVRRGLLRRQRFGNTAMGYTYVYAVVAP
jgi:hypothetical protein